MLLKHKVLKGLHYYRVQSHRAEILLESLLTSFFETDSVVRKVGEGERKESLMWQGVKRSKPLLGKEEDVVGLGW